MSGVCCGVGCVDKESLGWGGVEDQGRGDKGEGVVCGGLWNCRIR